MNEIPSQFVFRDARRESVPLLLGLMGPSGGGKTYSALRLATGIQTITGGDIYGIDTEARRMLHYADRFKFKHLEFTAPFGPDRYQAAIEHAVASGAKIIIVDSMSMEHEGPGGVLEMHAAELERLGGQESKKFLAWQKPKAMRRQMINRILQLNASFIFCFRAKDKIKIAAGKPVPQGFMPIAGEEFVFEMTANCLLLPHADGVPTWRSDEVGERMMMKLPEQFRGIFAEERPLSEEIGAALATWARGGSPAGEDEARAAARAAAALGKDALQTHWKGLDQATRRLVQPIMDDLKTTAAKVDDDPGGNRRPAVGEGGNAAELSATADPASDAQPDAKGGGVVEGDVAKPLPVDGSAAAASPRPLTPDERRKLRILADALSSVNTPAAVEKGARAFWQDNALGDDDPSPLAVAAVAIVEAQTARTRGELSIAEAEALTRKVLPL